MTGIMAAMATATGGAGAYNLLSSYYSPSQYSVFYGYNSAIPATSSIIPSDFNGSRILELDAGGIIASLYFRIEGEHDNAGFYALSVGGVEYRRTNATYTAYSPLYTQWIWATASVPFGSGTRHTVLIL
jgi:hypothetical protein